MWRAALLAGLMALAGGACAQGAACDGAILGAAYADPTDRYPHGALGDPFEWGALEVRLRVAPPCGPGRRDLRLILPEALVFEDVTPLLVDLDGDGGPEIVTVESHRNRGARLSVWARRGAEVVRIATTPHIGRRNRWLAIVGAGDLDGDGAVEIAWIDRPHLAKVLRIWRFSERRLEPVAEMAGLSNHRFGETAISGGIRDCGAGPEVVTADAEWSRVMVSRLAGGRIEARSLGPFTAAAMARAMTCR